MDDKEIFTLDTTTQHVRNMRLALIETIRHCLDKLYEDCPKASYEEAKQLGHISTLVNRINPDVQQKKQEEKKRRKTLEEEEE